MGSPHSSVGKESASNARDPGSSPGLGRYAGEGIGYPLQYSWASLVAQLVKNPPAMQETWVWSLDWEDPLEKGKTTCSSILAWRIPYSPWGRKASDTTEPLSLWALMESFCGIVKAPLPGLTLLQCPQRGGNTPGGPLVAPSAGTQQSPSPGLAPPACPGHGPPSPGAHTAAPEALTHPSLLHARRWRLTRL